MGVKNEGKPPLNLSEPNRFRDPRPTAAICGKSKPSPGTPFIGAKLGFRGVANGERPRLDPLLRPGAENPRAEPEKLRVGAGDPRMGAEPRPWPNADAARTAPSAITDPILYIPLAI